MSTVNVPVDAKARIKSSDRFSGLASLGRRKTNEADYCGLLGRIYVFFLHHGGPRISRFTNTRFPCSGVNCQSYKAYRGEEPSCHPPNRRSDFTHSAVPNGAAGPRSAVANVFGAREARPPHATLRRLANWCSLGTTAAVRHADQPGRSWTCFFCFWRPNVDSILQV